MLPRTLDDARRLVNLPILDDGTTIGEDGSVKEHAELAAQSSSGLKAEDRLMDLIGGRKPPRERSVDSAKSNGSRSGKNATPTSGSGASKDDTFLTPTIATTPASTFASPSAPTPPNAAFESVKNFGNTINPLNRLPGMIRGFGRNAPELPAGLSATVERFKQPGPADGISTPVKGDIEVSKIDSPIKRFLEIQDPGDLKVGDIAELLEDYKRLAAALTNIGAT
jgi:hypothetical protein